MPSIEIVFYQEEDGAVPPLVAWLDSLQAKAREKCLTCLGKLEERGHELGRPQSAPLGDGIYELRVKFFRVNLRMLYFFHERKAAVISHGLAKEKEVPPGEIKRAREHMARFKADPERHTFRLKQE